MLTKCIIFDKALKVRGQKYDQTLPENCSKSAKMTITVCKFSKIFRGSMPRTPLKSFLLLNYELRDGSIISISPITNTITITHPCNQFSIAITIAKNGVIDYKLQIAITFENFSDLDNATYTRRNLQLGFQPFPLLVFTGTTNDDAQQPRLQALLTDIHEVNRHAASSFTYSGTLL